MNPQELNAIKKAMEAHCKARGITPEAHELWAEQDAMVKAISAYKEAQPTDHGPTIARLEKVEDEISQTGWYHTHDGSQEIEEEAKALLKELDGYLVTLRLFDGKAAMSEEALRIIGEQIDRAEAFVAENVVPVL